MIASVLNDTHPSSGSASVLEKVRKQKYLIGAYYFPNYHVDPRNEKAHGKGWTEWELVKRGEPKFPGHIQPKHPVWGYEDEADPRVFARKIRTAAAHGLNHFIFDWYWYEDGPFLNRALEEGFLRSDNNSQLQFSIMWANHDWVEIHPAKLNVKPPVLYPGTLKREAFDQMVDYVITRYFSHPSYWKIESAPYFSIYELYRLIKGLGGIEKTMEALEDFRNKTKAAGFPDLHLNAVLWGVQVLPGESGISDSNSLLLKLQFSSTTSYVWVHDVQLPSFPATQYDYAMEKAAQHWRQSIRESKLPFHPNVTVGWDPSPRTCQSDAYVNAGYPFMPILVNNTPDRFKEALIKAKEFLDSTGGEEKILNINAWNEWTEGSYLEPDTTNKLAYLEVIRQIFN